MRSKFYALLFVSILMLCVDLVPAQAQFLGIGKHPLLDLLALAPDTPEVRDTWIRYMDFRAVEEARDWMQRPESAETLFADSSWIGFTYRWLSAPDSVRQSFFEAARMPEVVGFDIFDVDRTLSFGKPPSHGVIWSGDFDLAAIAATHAARGYIQTEIHGVPAWCSGDGCAAGMNVNPTERDLANIFDTGIGREVPFLLLPNLLVSAPDETTLERVADVTTGDLPSLAEAEDYHTLAEALIDPSVYMGQLVNLQFLPNEDVRFVLDLTADDVAAQVLSRVPDPQRAENFIRNAFVGYGDLPLYQLAAIADRQEGDRQVAIVALLYTNAEDAQIAAPELMYRMSTFSDLMIRELTESLFDLMPGMDYQSHVYTSEPSGLSVAVVEMRYDTPTEAQEKASSSDPESMTAALAFQYLSRTISSNSLYPLWVINFPEGN